MVEGHRGAHHDRRTRDAALQPATLGRRRAATGACRRPVDGVIGSDRSGLDDDWQDPVVSTQPLTADRAAVWLMSVLGGGLAMSFLAEWTRSAWLATLFAVVLLILVVSTFPGGFFSRSPGRHGPTLLGRLVAGALLVLYLVSAALLANHGGVAIQLGMTALLWQLHPS